MKAGNKPGDPVGSVQAPKSLNRPVDAENDAEVDDEVLIDTVPERLANPRRIKVSLKDL